MWPLAHTAFRMFPSSAHSHLCRSHPNLRHPQTCSSFLFAHLDISLPGGRPGVGGSGRGLCSLGKQPSLSESSPSSPRWLCHAHPRACEAWSGRGGEQGPPQARGPPPPPPATPGSTFLALPEPAWAGPVTLCPGCPGLSPVQGTGPWGPPFQVHVHPYSSGHPRSVCAPFWSFPMVELKPAGRRLGPWLHQAAGEVEASLVNNSEKQLEAARSPCAYVNSGASSKGHSLQAVLYWACQG